MGKNEIEQARIQSDFQEFELLNERLQDAVKHVDSEKNNIPRQKHNFMLQVKTLHLECTLTLKYLLSCRLCFLHCMFLNGDRMVATQQILLNKTVLEGHAKEIPKFKLQVKTLFRKPTKHSTTSTLHAFFTVSIGSFSENHHCQRSKQFRSWNCSQGFALGKKTN